MAGECLDVKTNNNYAFRWACANGHLPVARWLHETFIMTNEVASAALRESCRNGQTCVVRWLCASFSVAGSFLRPALCAACACGRMPIVQHLCSKFGLTRDDMMAARNACLEHGEYTLRWLYVQTGLNWIDQPWSHRMHSQWYWQPQVIAAAGELPRHMLYDVIRRI